MPCYCKFKHAHRGSTIALAGCGIWLILRARFEMQVKSRGGKRDFKYGRVFGGSGCGNREV